LADEDFLQPEAMAIKLAAAMVMNPRRCTSLNHLCILKTAAESESAFSIMCVWIREFEDCWIDVWSAFDIG